MGVGGDVGQVRGPEHGLVVGAVPHAGQDPPPQAICQAAGGGALVDPRGLDVQNPGAAPNHGHARPIRPGQVLLHRPDFPVLPGGHAVELAHGAVGKGAVDGGLQEGPGHLVIGNPPPRDLVFLLKPEPKGLVPEDVVGLQPLNLHQEIRKGGLEGGEQLQGALLQGRGKEDFPPGKVIGHRSVVQKQRGVYGDPPPPELGQEHGQTPAGVHGEGPAPGNEPGDGRQILRRNPPLPVCQGVVKVHGEQNIRWVQGADLLSDVKSPGHRGAMPARGDDRPGGRSMLPHCLGTDCHVAALLAMTALGAGSLGRSC